MELSPISRRSIRSSLVVDCKLALCAVLILIGCTGMRPNGDADTSHNQNLNVTSSLAREINDGNLNIKIENAGSTTRAVIRAQDGQEPEFNVLRLNSPERLVLDFPSSRAISSKSYDIAGIQTVSALRFGKHGDTQRLVFDLPSSAIQHQAEVVDGNIVLTLTTENFNANQAMAALKSDTKTALREHGEDDEDSMEEEDEDAPDSSEPEHPMPSEKEASAVNAAVDNGSRLTGLKLQSDSDQNMLIAEVSSSGVYSLKRTAPSEFVLTLENTELDSKIARPLLSLPSAGKIRSVRPMTQGNDVQLRIFVEENAELQVQPRDGKLIVTSNSSSNQQSSYAQLNPEAIKGDEKSDAKKEIKDDTAAAPSAEASEKDVIGDNSDIGASGLDELLVGEKRYTGRLISLDLQETDIDNALRIIAEVSNLNIIASGDVSGKVTLRLIDVPWDQALDVILKTNGLDMVREGNVVRIAPVEKLRAERESLKAAQKAEEELEGLSVRYIRISYAKASEVKPLVEAVLSERGSVATDERTNQLIIKDIKKGVNSGIELVKKLDLRTPQVLIETQIVEAQRSFLRDLGAVLGWSLIASPATGNALGTNFPNSVNIAGGLSPGSNIGVAYPASNVSAAAGSAITAIFGSADGSKTIDARISASEQEGTIRVVSKPSVATINNKQATIKNVEKIRIKLPNSGLSVATGQGATASGGGTTATEVIEVGITLEITPQASPDYYVLMDINAKSSSFGTRVVENIPSEIERSATSSVLVSSGQTFALGGIYKITDRNTITGVPFLKDVPVFGNMFRSTSIDNGDEELIFFITPRIIEGSFDDAAMRPVL